MTERLGLLLLLAMLPSSVAAQTAPPAAATNTPIGHIEDARNFWKEPTSYCGRCHGPEGEGGFGPDLAGRGLSFEEFRQALREPWGVMPRYNERIVTDQTIADLTAYFASLPKVTKLGAWRSPAPSADAPAGERALTITAGCSQCHDPVGAQRVGSWRWGNARADLGATGKDYAWFETNAYDHDKNYPDGRMPTWSRERFPEPLLREGWRWLTQDLGLRPRIRAEVEPGIASGSNTKYTITVVNRGEPGKGLKAEEMTLTLPLAAGIAVVAATGKGYQGVGRDASSGSQMATWTFPRLAAGDKEVFTVTLSGPTTAADISKDALVNWKKPKVAGVSEDAVRLIAVAVRGATQ